MIIQYGDGWMQFPERVWEPTGKDENGETLWSTRPATIDDILRRKEMETPKVEE